MALLKIHRRKEAPAPRGSLVVTKSGKAISAPNVFTRKDAPKLQVFVCEQDGNKFAAVMDSEDGENATVRLAIPSPTGILVATDQKMVVARAGMKELKDAIVKQTRVERVLERAPFETKMRTVEKAGVVSDYLDVIVEGFGSTFVETTAADRDGDWIMPGAFDQSIRDFRNNPVMLADHTNLTNKQAGSFSKISITDKGLALTGNVTNSPLAEMRHIRFLIAEGHLKAFSIGGLFFFSEGNWHAIETVFLYETSIIPIPANQDALFQARSVTLSDAVKMLKHLSV